VKKKRKKQQREREPFRLTLHPSRAISFCNGAPTGNSWRESTVTLECSLLNVDGQRYGGRLIIGSGRDHGDYCASGSAVRRIAATSGKGGDRHQRQRGKRSLPRQTRV
jgi:hypothetical protein